MTVVRHSLGHSANCLVLSFGLLGITAPLTYSQSPPPSSKPPSTAAAAEAGAKNAVVIERSSVIFRDPAKYQVNLHLEPVRRVVLAATIDGVVSNLQTKAGDEIAAQAEAIRLDSRSAQMKSQRAQAALKAAKAELEATKEKAAAQARVEVAEIDVAIADFDQSRTVIRSPLKGVISAMLVIEGEYVRAGQPLAIVTDPSTLYTDIPIDGKTQKAGDAIEIKVEDANVSAKIESVQPLLPQLDPLRDLFVSPATGRVVLDNKNGKLRVGQSVYSAMIPRLPVAEIPTSAIVNAEQGGRKVQVIREGFVRDVPVQMLGQVGADHLFVSGRFGMTDELIVKTSEPLIDGARVMARDPKSAGKPANTPQPAPPASGGANF